MKKEFIPNLYALLLFKFHLTNCLGQETRDTKTRMLKLMSIEHAGDDNGIVLKFDPAGVSDIGHYNDIDKKIELFPGDFDTITKSKWSKAYAEIENDIRNQLGEIKTGQKYQVVFIYKVTQSGEKQWMVSSMEKIKPDVEFMNQLQKAIIKKNKVWIADHTQYPVAAYIGKRRIKINNKQAFLLYYGKIFSLNFKKYILNSAPSDIVRKGDGEAGLARGSIWISNWNNNRAAYGDYLIFVINDSR